MAKGFIPKIGGRVKGFILENSPESHKPVDKSPGQSPHRKAQESSGGPEALEKGRPRGVGPSGAIRAAGEGLVPAKPGVTQSRRGGSDGFSGALPSPPDCLTPCVCIRCLGGTS